MLLNVLSQTQNWDSIDSALKTPGGKQAMTTSDDFLFLRDGRKYVYACVLLNVLVNVLSLCHTHRIGNQLAHNSDPRQQAGNDNFGQLVVVFRRTKIRTSDVYQMCY